MSFATDTAVDDVLALRRIQAQIREQVVDIPTRDGVTQRFIYLTPPQPVATVILFAGGQGGLQIFPMAAWGAARVISWCVRVVCLLTAVWQSLSSMPLQTIRHHRFSVAFVKLPNMCATFRP